MLPLLIVNMAIIIIIITDFKYIYSIHLKTLL